MPFQTNLPPAAPHSTHMMEKLGAQGQSDCRQFLAYGRTDLFEGDDGWTWARLSAYQTAWVALKVESERVLYQCGCSAFKKIAPQPCEHVVAALIFYEQNPRVIPKTSAPHASQTPPMRRLASMVIAAASEDTEPYLVQDSKGKTLAAEVTARAPVWKPYLDAMRDASERSSVRPFWPEDRELIYVIDAVDTVLGNSVVVEPKYRDPKKGGGWKAPVGILLSADLLTSVPAADRDAITLLLSAEPFYGNGYGGFHDRTAKRKLTSYLAERTMPVLSRTGRCFFEDDSDSPGTPPVPIRWEDERWDFSLSIVRDDAKQQYVITSSLDRAAAAMPLHQATMLTPGGLAFWQEEGAGEMRVAPYNDHEAFEWVTMLRHRRSLRVPVDQGDELLAELYRFRKLPQPHLPQELSLEEVSIPPSPRLTIKAPPKPKWQGYQADTRLVAEVAFEYNGMIVPSGETGAAILDKAQRRIIRRDQLLEAAAIQRLQALGGKQDRSYNGEPSGLRIAQKQVPAVVRSLLLEGWHVEAEGKLYRQAGELKFEVSSGIDWFDLNVSADFGGVSAPLPRLLAALRRGEAMVQLDDGTFGVLPEAWLKKYAPLASVATEQGDSLRFKRTQAGLLDALLAAQPQANVDAAFRQVREELRRFKGLRSIDPPATFQGSLRPYQLESQGWFDFLRQFGFGGCLADDMGLGKTVQVLALLEQRRVDKIGRPSVVVVPRSLIFNWTQEATKFAPRLRVLDHSTTGRLKGSDHFENYDLVLTTYGTLRRDAVYMKDTTFDYVILDEAQAIKNADSESAKAARLLQGDHRLVLSGTPVQNHLGDLWSLFEFLNPGMLGRASIFTGSISTGKAPEPETQQLLAKGLRPFILRRTKEQVAQDLPPRQEQTIYCELEGEQRKLYNELRDHYRSSLLGLIDKQGVNRSKIQILEALLRLRQAACHPALVNKSHAAIESAKLTTLIPQLQELIEGGHKALVFSQFTQFLSLVKKELDKATIRYEYLDGKTRDRQKRVEHFQTDPECKLFLISLKAGGVGLNLIAADYAFLLDPWWNPAVEAQAIDRTHRIGQTKHVFACRLIAKDTVEEKVLALQQTKKALADAIVNADNALIKTIGREDLELLLS